MAVSKWSTTELAGQTRTLGTKSANKKLRAEFRLPAVIYGAGIKENINISIDYVAFEKLFAVNERHIPFTLTVNSDKHHVIVRDYKIDPISRRFMHVDFCVIAPNTMYTTLIPIEFVGIPVGVREGGNLLTYMRKILIRATPEQMPAKITHDISQLQRKKNVIVRDLDISEQCKVLTNRGTVLTEVK
ncbi:MAG: 50S ribosomal protein L25 [Brevinema sp.]